MSRTPQWHSAQTRRRADARLRRLTRFAALMATGATVAIGVVAAREHPGSSASSDTVPTQAPTTSAPSTSTTLPASTAPTSQPDAGGSSRSTSSSTIASPPTTTTTSPRTTTTRPVVTSGGTSQ
jgi:cytoskeletal protein RodZ